MSRKGAKAARQEGGSPHALCVLRVLARDVFALSYVLSRKRVINGTNETSGPEGGAHKGLKRLIWMHIMKGFGKGPAARWIHRGERVVSLSKRISKGIVFKKDRSRQGAQVCRDKNLLKSSC